MITPSPVKQPIKSSHDELILVVKRIHLLGQEQIHGLKIVDFNRYATLINEHKEFLPRGLMETDPTYKQIIPYLIFEYNDRYFLMQRRHNASETRLQSKFSLGIGGHIRKEDMQSMDIMMWAQREFHEEVDYKGSLKIKPLGLLNDDTDDVGKVHIGFVFLLQGDSPEISIKSELKSGTLATLEECALMAHNLEGWSQKVLSFLQEGKKQKTV